MYALIFKDISQNKIEKKVISVHASRKDSERALKKRQAEFGKDTWVCRTRIVWTDKAVQPGDIIGENDRLVWGS